MATARLDLRIDEDIKAKAEKASALLGLKSLTEYVAKLMDENASKVIAEHESIAVKDDIFHQFMAAAYFGLSGHLFRFHPARRFGVIRPA